MADDDDLSGNLATLLRVAGSLQIAHHIPGRVRFKLDVPVSQLRASVIDDAKQLKQAIQNIPGVRAVNLNAMARSCTVEYDHAYISPVAWEHVAAGTASPQADALFKLLAEVLSPSARSFPR